MPLPYENAQPAQEHPISSGHPDDAGFELWWSEHMPEAVQSVAVSAWNAAQPTVQAQERKQFAGFEDWWKESKPAECDEVKIEMLNFLYGAGELDGVWFGEHHPTAKGEFWWREHLRRVFPLIA